MIGLNMKDGHVRVTHMPTGIYAESCAERGQHRNRQRAMEVLRARMYASANIERVDVIVRHYDLPDGATAIPDAVLNDIGKGGE